MECICGADTYEEFTQPAYVVDDVGSTAKSVSEYLHLAKCLKCGVIRQTHLPFDDVASYEEYYRSYPPTKKSYKAKDFKHDVEVAQKRCRVYGIFQGYDGRVLDVGSGSGAFVSTAREYGADAYGCEIARYHYAHPNESDWTYRRRFEDCNFPTDYWDMVVCHDVLEHVVDPVAFILELYRVTKQGGAVFVDFPNYFSDAGRHHWKINEHIWFFTIPQLSNLFKEAGFTIVSVSKPVESKVLFRLEKPSKIARPRILVPPGIGDSYWSIVKLEAFLQREGLGLPDISVVCPRSKDHDGHLRSFPFLEMFPFLHSTYTAIEGRVGPRRANAQLAAIWREAYMEQGRTIFKNICGFDYFISYNGHLRVGKRLEDVDPDLQCNWFPRMFISLEQTRYQTDARAEYGDYIVFYFVFQGTYTYWTKQFPVPSVVSFVNSIVGRTGLIPVFVGAQWDANEKRLSQVIRQVPGAVDLRGKTSVEQLFGLLKGAQVVVGYPSGLTIMSTVLGTRTVIIWNDYYNRKFAQNCCPPTTLGKNYWIENTRGLTPQFLTEFVEAVLSGTGRKLPHRTLPEQRGSVVLSNRRGVCSILMPKSVMDVASVRIEDANTGVSPRLKSLRPRLAVACVLKSGGDFNPGYVTALERMVDRNLKIDYEFICLTDYPEGDLSCRTVRLESNLAGWWSKAELFRPGLFDAERVLYFDLDTLILDNIDDIASLSGDFYGLRPWNRANRNKGILASGVMTWVNNGLLEFIWNMVLRGEHSKYDTDQQFITESLVKGGVKYCYLQDAIHGIYSYKRECQSGRPADSRIICFHGKPRIHEVKEGWVRQIWSY